MTQHQAPEVTSEPLPCPFDSAPALTVFVQAGVSWWQVECSKCTAHVDAPTEAAAITAWNTRATQPLSLTVDDETVAQLRDLMAKANGAYTDHSDWLGDIHGYTAADRKLTAWRNYLPALLDRLQSLSLPRAGEQIAENANCSVDIDRSGLAQEVEK